MDKQSIIQKIKDDSQFENFVNSDNASMKLNLLGIPLIIFKKDVGVSYYYLGPCDDCRKRKEINEIMDIIIPHLSKLVEDVRRKKLM